MKKNVFYVALCAMLFALCSVVEAQQLGKMYRIGFLIPVSPELTFLDAFRKGLRELGYVEGKNLILEIRSAQGKSDRLPGLATELVDLKVDIIVATAGPAIQAAKRATSTIPIVMRIGSDPVETGVIAGLAQPGGNVTGIASINLGLIGKRLEVLLDVVPGVKRVAVLSAQADPARFMATDEYKEMEAAARTLDVKLQLLWARDPNAIDTAFATMTKQRPQALVVIPSPRYLQNRERILKNALKSRLPSIYPHSLFVENGGLMSYGADFADEHRRLAVYVDKILKGAKPGDLPIEQAKKFEFIINLKTAKEIGLKIPPNVLARADRIIK